MFYEVHARSQCRYLWGCFGTTCSDLVWIIASYRCTVPTSQGDSDGAAAVPETPSGRQLGPFGRLAASLPMPIGDGAQNISSFMAALQLPRQVPGLKTGRVRTAEPVQPADAATYLLMLRRFAECPAVRLLSAAEAWTDAVCARCRPNRPHHCHVPHSDVAVPGAAAEGTGGSRGCRAGCRGRADAGADAHDQSRAARQAGAVQA